MSNNTHSKIAARVQHLMRPPSAAAQAAARVRKAAAAARAAPAVEYPPGWFTEPVRAWAQLKFVSRFTSQDTSRQAAQAQAERERQEAEGAGWAAKPLGLEGAMTTPRPRWLPARKAGER